MTGGLAIYPESMATMGTSLFGNLSPFMTGGGTKRRRKRSNKTKRKKVSKRRVRRTKGKRTRRCKCKTCRCNPCKCNKRSSRRSK